MGTAKSWCGLVVRDDWIGACLLREGEEKQVQSFRNSPDEHQRLADWLAAEKCTHIALNPSHESWKQVYGLLKKTFAIRLVQEQMVMSQGPTGEGTTCCQWLAQLLKSGRLDKLDQVEPIGDRTPHTDADALGGQRGQSPEHSGQGSK